jgi:hypothetical protein
VRFRELHSDIPVAAIVGATAIAAFVLTYGFDSAPASLMHGLGADIFPRLVLVMIVIMAALLGLGAFGRSPTPGEPITPRFHTTLAASIAFVPIVALIGMIPAMVVYMIGVGRLWGERRLGALAANATGTGCAIWLLFVRGFNIPLPRGFLGEFFF